VQYAAGLILYWKPNVSGTGGPTTLNVDGLGAKTVKQADGTSDPQAADIVAGRMYPIWYDGTVFRMVASPSMQPRTAFEAALCAATGSLNAYSCSLSPALAQYAAGLILYWKPDVSGTGGPTTLNVDGLGAKPVRQADGTSNPRTADVIAGRLHPVWYDGTVFRMLQTPAASLELEQTAHTKADAQAGRTVLCDASGAAGAYTCAMAPALTAYTVGMVVNWKPGTGSSGGPVTLNIDGLGAQPVKQSDGISDPASVTAGQLTPIWYDGVVFRIMQAPNAPTYMAGTWSSLPVCDGSKSAQTYSFTDTLYENAYCNGTAWTFLADGQQVNPPNPAAFSWVNQSSATTSTAAGGMQLIGSPSTGHSLNMLVKAAPAAPFTVDALIQIRHIKYNYPACGIVIRDSTSGKIDFVKEYIGGGFMTFAVEKYTSPTSAPTTAIVVDPNPMTYGKLWVRVADNGSSRTTSISEDGAYWQQVHTHTGANYFTPDQIGIGCNSWTSNKRPQMTLWSWKEQ
jgi:hypothetical protein